MYSILFLYSSLNSDPPPVYPSGPPQMTNAYPSQPTYNPAINPPQPPMYAPTVPNYGGGTGGTTVIIAVS